MRCFDRMAVERGGGTLTVRARKRITDDDPYLASHFPGIIVFPGVFIIECLQQAVAFALGRFDGTTSLQALRSVRFLAPLFVGDDLTLDATVALTPENDTFAVAAECRRG